MTPPFATHDALPVPHGFFGRQGGVSGGLYASLNCGHGSDDDPDHVSINRARVAASLGGGTLQGPHQIHSDRCVIIEEPLASPVQADALVTWKPDLILSVLSADCAPILFVSETKKIIGAAHAGWRGAFSGVAESTIAQMCEIGAHHDDIIAVIGPTISGENYEVGKEYRQARIKDHPESDPYFQRTQSGAVHFDLPAFLIARIRGCGVERVHWTGECTYADEARYFSYRRNTHQGVPGYGRNISAIRLPD